MSRVLFVTWDGGGNVPPALAIAAELRERGDSVRFMGHESQRGSIERHGFEFEGYTHARPWSVVAVRQGPAAALGYAGVFTDKAMAEDLRATIDRGPVDYAVIDGLLLGAMAGAARLTLPYSVLVHSLLSVTDATLNRGPLALIARLKGLHPRRLYAGADRLIVATLAALDPASAPSDPRVVFTGPMVTGAPAMPGKPPLVLVSLSTTYIEGQREVLQTILDAVAPLPVQVIVTTGPGVDPESLVPSPNADVRGFAPHVELMPGASLVVGHGGHATTMLALAHGVPLLVLPMTTTFDQPTIGRLVEEHGAGLTMSKKSSPEQIRAAVERLLAESEYRIAAEGLGSTIRAQNSAAVAAEALSGANSRVS